MNCFNLPKDHVKHSKYDTEAKMWNAMGPTIHKEVDEDGYRIESMDNEVKKFCHTSFQQVRGNNN